jgi:uncharacterized glyoxalase superfamily protein PhnB
MRQKLSLVTLGVRDLKRALDFYQTGLGWKPSSASSDDMIFIPMGGIVLGLYPREKLAEDVTIDALGHGFSGITLAHNTKSRAEVDEVLQTVARVGGKIVKPAQQVFWGGYSGYFADPDGHLWEVAWNPYSQFDANDNLVLPE